MFASRAKYVVALITTVVVLGLLPIIHSLADASTTSFRDPLDVYLDAVNLFELIPLFPLVVSLLSVVAFVPRQSARHLVNERLRLPTGRLLHRYLTRAVLLPAAGFFSFAFLPGLFAFGVAPRLGVFDISAHGYGLSAGADLAESYSRSTFTWLLQVGPGFVVGAYATWLAFLAALFAAFSLAIVLTVRHRVLALLLPWIVYIGETVMAAGVASPGFGLAYEAFPAGLEPIGAGALFTPPALLLLATAVLWMRVLRKPGEAVGLA